MKYAIIFLAFMLTFHLNSQNTNSDSYYPLTTGVSKTLTWYKGKYREVIKDTVTLEGKLYTHMAQIFPPKNTIDIYLRNSNDTIYFFNTVKKTHVPFFGINPVVGETIGNGTVKKVNATLKTPKGKLRNLLIIEMNYSNGAKDTRYYKRGLGLVGVKDKKKLICYYIPD